MSDSKKEDIYEPLFNAAPEVQRIVKKVFDLEKEHIYQEKPHNVKENIKRIIKEEIK
jgi:hypothetical protein